MIVELGTIDILILSLFCSRPVAKQLHIALIPRIEIYILPSGSLQVNGSGVRHEGLNLVLVLHDAGHIAATEQTHRERAVLSDVDACAAVHLGTAGFGSRAIEGIDQLSGRVRHGNQLHGEGCLISAAGHINPGRFNIFRQEVAVVITAQDVHPGSTGIGQDRGVAHHCQQFTSRTCCVGSIVGG